MIIRDMPKIESPFVRELDKKNHYIVINKINPGYEWVFNDDTVLATEKLDGTNVSIIIEKGKITRIFNRENEIPFFNKNHLFIIQAVINSYGKGYCNFTDGQYFGEVIGPKVQGNPYNLKEHLWIPFSSYVREHLTYKSWGKYPKDYETIRNWFKTDIFSLFMRRRDSVIQKPEGIVFVQPSTGRMAKLRVDMFDFYYENPNNKEHKKEVKK